jgi:hypothetical protein
MRLRLWFPLTLLLIVLAGLVLAATPTAAAPLAGPGGGWVKANVVGGGLRQPGPLQQRGHARQSDTLRVQAGS